MRNQLLLSLSAENLCHLSRKMTGGIDGLSKTKGCPPILSKKNEPKNKKKSTTKATSEERERIEELEKRVRSLQIENAFLKAQPAIK